MTSILKLLRYRFLLIAGLFPYGLGAAVAFYSQGRFDLFLFLTGFVGLIFVLIGVEAFNEFFDWQMGSDRVFQLNPKPVTYTTFLFGIAVFCPALVIAIFLTLKLGMPIIVLSIIGFFAALFYLAPPIKLAYRGVGEITIALSYGPLMMLGSYYVQTERLALIPIFVSILPALLLFAISIFNEVPEYYQDKLVGKRNICVRIGKRNVIRLYGGILVLFYVSLFVGLISGIFPTHLWFVLACVPISLRSYIIGKQHYDNPLRFISAIRYMIIHYVIVLGILIIGFIVA